jgi:myxalamid-type polyketide synthase MxaE and MxaD
VRPFARTGADDVAAHLRSVRLAEALDAATAQQRLDFFCVLGAAAPVWGAAGTSARAAAEGMASGFAAHLAARGRPVRLLRWMPRTDTGELSPRDERLMADSGVNPLTAPDIGAAFGALLRAGYADASLANIDEAQYVRVCRDRRDRRFLALLDAGTDRPVDADRTPLVAELLAAPQSQRESRLLGHVLSHVAEVLGEDAGAEVAPDQGFFELGMDSVMSVSLRGRLERSLGVDLPATLAFEFPTTRALTRHVLDLIAPPTADPDIDADALLADPESLDELSDADLIDRLQAALASSESLLGEGI